MKRHSSLLQFFTVRINLLYFNIYFIFWVFLDEKLNFSHHIKENISKACKGIAVIRKLYYVLPRHSLLTIYKSSISHHLDYGDMYDQPNNQAFSNKLEVVQYNAALAIAGAIRGTSRTKVYQELGLESRYFYKKKFFLVSQNTF